MSTEIPQTDLMIPLQKWGFVILSVMGVGLHQMLQRVKARVLFWAPSETAVRVINA